MTQRVERFWQALERVPDLAAVAAEWRALLGDDLAAVERFLRPTPRLAGSVRCAAPGRTCVHDVRQWKGRFLSVCPDGCEPAEITRDEVTIHRLDVAALAREVAEAVGLEPVAAELVSGVAGAWHVGDYVPYAGLRFPAYLALTGEPEALAAVADGLAARGRPFVLLAPTRSAFTQAAADTVWQTKASFLPLDELLGSGDDGRLALLDGLTADGVLAEFRAAHVPQPKADDGMVFFPTPAGARWGDVSIRFIDRHSVYVTVKGARDVPLRADGHGQQEEREADRSVGAVGDVRRSPRPAGLAESEGEPQEPEAQGKPRGGPATLLPHRGRPVRARGRRLAGAVRRIRPRVARRRKFDEPFLSRHQISSPAFPL